MMPTTISFAGPPQGLDYLAGFLAAFPLGVWLGWRLRSYYFTVTVVGEHSQQRPLDETRLG